MKKLLIIDGNAILHRAFHALPAFTAWDGTPTNAVFGFIRILLGLLDKLHPDYLAVCFDTPKPTFRDEMYKHYRAQRPKSPDEFKVQVPLTQEFLKKAGIAYFLQDGFEADDLIGSLVKQIHRQESDVLAYIVTGDKDILQLVNEQTTVVMPAKGVSGVDFVNRDKVRSRLGVDPEQIVDYKALVGDPSDNYKGIKGIGPKTALQLLQKYKSLETIYEHLEEIEPKVRQRLKEYKQDALLAKRLALIRQDLTLVIDKNKLKPSLNAKNQELLSFLDKLSLKSIKKKLLEMEGFSDKAHLVDKTPDNQLSFF